MTSLRVKMLGKSMECGIIIVFSMTYSIFFLLRVVVVSFFFLFLLVIFERRLGHRPENESVGPRALKIDQTSGSEDFFELTFRPPFIRLLCGPWASWSPCGQEFRYFFQRPHRFVSKELPEGSKTVQKCRPDKDPSRSENTADFRCSSYGVRPAVDRCSSVHAVE